MPQSTRVFLSYARRDATALAESVAASLKQQGYEVWRDRPEIRPGQAFMSEIEAAIARSSVVVALLSPNSVRRQGEIDHLDSVCLDELAFARFSKPPVPIVPVMAVECRPPLEIYRLDYVDLTHESDRQAGLQRLGDGIAAALRGETRYRSWVDNLRSWDFRNIVGHKRRDFVGREWLIDEVFKWLAQDSEAPALIIKGDPGSGKSAVLAEMIHRNPAGLLGYHFCQAETPETLRPGRFVRSIAAMIASQLPEYEARLAAGLPKALDEAVSDEDPFSSFEEGILAPLDSLASPPAGAFLLIDALDESLARRDVQRGATIVELLADRIYRIPKWLRIVATTRREPDVLRRLRGLPHREIDVHSDNNQDDIETYVRKWAARAGGRVKALTDGEIQGLVTSLRRSGNFLVVVETLKSVEQGLVKLEEVDRLAPGLYPLYERFFARSFPERGSGDAMTPAIRKVLQVVLAAQRNLTERQLSEVTGLSTETELPAALKALTQFVQERTHEDGTIEYSIYHKSFADWLTDPQLRGTPYYVGRLEGHRQLAAKFSSEYAGGVENLTDYSLAYGVSHARNSEDAARVFEVLTDAAYLRRKVHVLGLQPLLEDFHDLDKLPGLRPEQRQGLQALRQALRLLTPIVADGLVEFEVQLEARIRSADALGGLRESLRTSFQPGSLRPASDSLPAWDGPLQMALKGVASVSAVGIFFPRLWGVTGDDEGLIRVWDLETGLPIVGTSINPEGCSSCAVHPSEPLAIFGTYQSPFVAVVDLESGELERRVPPGFTGGGAVSFSHNGENLLSCHSPWSDKGPTGIACWETKGSKPLWIHRFKKGAQAESVAWLPGDRGILVMTGTELLSFSPQGKLLDTLLRVPPTKVNRDAEKAPEDFENLAIDQGGKRLAIARQNGRIDLYDAATMKQLGSLRGHPMEFYTTSIPAMYFVGEKTLITGGWDGAVRIWDLERHAELRSYQSSTKIFDMAVFDEGRRALSGQKIYASRVWNLDAAVAATDESEYMGSLHVDPGRRRAIGKYGRCGCRFIDLETQQHRDWNFGEETHCVAFQAQSDQAVVVAGNEIHAIDLKSSGNQGHKVATLKFGEYDSISDAVASEDGSVILCESGSQAIVWRAGLGTQKLKLDEDDYVYEPAVSARWAALSFGKGPIRLFDLTRRQPRSQLVHIEGSDIHSLAISRNGTFLAAGYQDGHIRVVDLRPDGSFLQLIADINAHREWVSRLRINDAGRVCSVGLDGVICLSDVKRARVLSRLTSEEGWGDCVLEEDGRTMWIAAGRGSRVHRLQYAESGD